DATEQAHKADTAVEPAPEPGGDEGGEADTAVEPAPEPGGDGADEVGSAPPAAAPEAHSSAPAPPPAPPGATPAGRPPAPGAPPRPPKPTGRVVEGVVSSVSSEEVELTLDDGRPAVINRRNFGPNNEDPASVLSVGDRAFGAELAREDPKARVVLSRAWALKKLAWERVLQAASAKTTLTGKVTSVGAKGVVVDVGLRGFVPTSHLELEPVADLSPYLDQVLELKVLEADPQRERLVLSRRSLLLKEQRKKAQELLTSLKPGESCRGRVTSITNYGAFVDLGGVNGLVHLSELSWKRVRRPNDVVALGDEVEVRILDVKAKKRRVSLSLRQMRPDPLTELEVGQIYRGPVTRLVDFGAFVAIGEVEGLVHLSELAEYRVSTPEEVVTPGEEVGVKVLSIDPKRRRIELSIRQAAEFGG
ncbi:MAG: S1 RNA-binding domain-containing protein, partial [Acidimicrobiia bacterium]|nr:S1 RNA-binding domain-containing protein [Acidimicrobiia bacterium]